MARGCGGNPLGVVKFLFASLALGAKSHILRVDVGGGHDAV